MYLICMNQALSKLFLRDEMCCKDNKLNYKYQKYVLARMCKNVFNIYDLTRNIHEKILANLNDIKCGVSFVSDFPINRKEC
jgi:hypothetical protein